MNATTPISKFNYVLITAAKDEARTVKITLESVIAQSILPTRWVFIDDGSTDETPEVVDNFAKLHPWIQLLRRNQKSQRDFASVVRALNYALNHINLHSCTHAGVLDADIKLPPTYYEQILSKFSEDPLLGLAGGAVIDIGTPRLDCTSSEEVAGAVQFFASPVLQKIKPFIEIPEGGWDAVTNSLVRNIGNRTKCFPSIKVDHLKPRNAAFGNIFKRKWQYGQRDYALGHSLTFQVLKTSYHLFEFPWVIGSLLRFASYTQSKFIDRPRALPDTVLTILRRERKKRISDLIFKQKRW